MRSARDEGERHRRVRDRRLERPYDLKQCPKHVPVDSFWSSLTAGTLSSGGDVPHLRLYRSKVLFPTFSTKSFTLNVRIIILIIETCTAKNNGEKPEKAEREDSLDRKANNQKQKVQTNSCWGCSIFRAKRCARHGMQHVLPVRHSLRH
jgi:hypothetical protein